MIPFFIKQFQGPLESTGLMKVLQVFYQVEFRAFLAVLVSFGIVLAFGPRTIRWLVRQKVGDAPEFNNADVNELMRSRAGTPTMGGVLICGAIVLTVLFLADLRERYVHLALAIVVSFGLLGMADDWLKLTTARRSPGSRDGLRPWEKLLFQIGLAAMFSWVLFSQATIDPDVDIQSAARVLNLPFQRTFDPGVTQGVDSMLPALTLNPGVFVLGVGLFVFLGTLVIAGTSNAVNISDGMDGLAAGVMTIGAIAFMIVARLGTFRDSASTLSIPCVENGPDLMVVSGAMAGACLGFLWFNSSPAKVFMGDTGSLALGGLLGYLAVALRQEIVLILVGGIFFLELGSVVVQVGWFKFTRIRTGKGVRLLRCSPIHHHFHLGGWSEQQVVTRFWLITIVLSMAAFALVKLR
ncbi:MAG: phospho-N-acetylmuramoyl-pentapeptide-transferase [Phycisphaerae bacterium]|nr:phospho-N-acetylmuramoyl-pentapeptide-transferase [Phycisphaerae bacterium]